METSSDSIKRRCGEITVPAEITAEKKTELRRQARREANRKDVEVRAIYGPNTEAVAALIDRWKNLSLSELVRFGFLLRSAGSAEETAEIEQTDDSDLVICFVARVWVQDSDDADEDDSDDDAASDDDDSVEDIVHDAWDAIADAAGDAAEAALVGAGRRSVMETAKSAIADVFSSVVWDIVDRQTLEPWWSRMRAEGRIPPIDDARVCVVPVVVNAVLALVTWDLAMPDSPYTPGMRNILHEPWKQVMERSGNAG